MSHKSHSWTWKVCGWMCCAKCGLVPLRNDATRAAMIAPPRSSVGLNELLAATR